MLPSQNPTSNDEKHTIQNNANWYTYTKIEPKLITQYKSYNPSQCFTPVTLTDQQHLCISEYDNIHIKDKVTGTTIKIWHAHDKPIYSLLQLKDGRLVSGSADTTIKVWDIEKEQCVKVLEGHDRGIRILLELQNGMLLSAGEDRKIKVWDLTNGDCVTTFDCTDHGPIGSIIEIDNERIVIGVLGNLLIFNKVNRRFIDGIYLDCTDQIYSLCKLSNYILLCGLADGSISAVDINRHQILKRLLKHNTFVSSLIELNDHRVVSASIDGSIMIWDIHSGKCITSIDKNNKYEQHILCELADGSVASMTSSSLKLWDFGLTRKRNFLTRTLYMMLLLPSYLWNLYLPSELLDYANQGYDRSKSKLGLRKRRILINSLILFSIISDALCPYLLFLATEPYEKDPTNDHNTNPYLIFYCFTQGATFLLTKVKEYHINDLIGEISAEMTIDFAQKILSLSFHDREKLEESKEMPSTSQIFSTVEKLVNNHYITLPGIAGLLVSCTIIGVEYNLGYTFGFMLASLVVYGTYHFFQKIYRSEDAQKEYGNKEREASDILSNALSNSLDSIKIKPRSTWLQDKILQSQAEKTQAYMELQRIQYFALAGKDVLGVAFIVTILVLAFNELKKHQKNPSDILFIIRTGASVFSNVSSIASNHKGISIYKNQMNQLLKIIKESIPEEIKWNTDAKIKVHVQSSLIPRAEDEKTTEKVHMDAAPLISFDNVLLSQDRMGGGFRLEIDKLEFKPNTLSVIVGRSGAGKSQLVKLIMGVSRQFEGVIAFDGRNIRNFSLSSLRKSIGFVSQNPIAFKNLGLRENVNLGLVDSHNISSIDAAIEEANLSERKYDGNISCFSGGELQRMDFSRVWLRRDSCKVCILDEPTSAQDNESQHKMFETIVQLKSNATIVMITHRLELVKYADQVIFLKKIKEGSLERSTILAAGKHEELLESCREYFELYRKQEPLNFQILEDKKSGNLYYKVPIPQLRLSWYYALIINELLPFVLDNKRDKFIEAMYKLFPGAKIHLKSSLWLILQEFEPTISFMMKNIGTWNYSIKYFKKALRDLFPDFNFDLPNFNELCQFIQRSIVLISESSKEVINVSVRAITSFKVVADIAIWCFSKEHYNEPKISTDHPR